MMIYAQQIPDSYFNRAELRNALEERLAEMTTTVYLASHERGDLVERNDLV